MKTLFYTTVLLLSLALSCCKDNNPDETPTPKTPQQEQLPPITTTGAGTFGCKVNGKVWVAKSNKTGWPPTYASVDRHNQYLTTISGDIVNKNEKFLSINVLFKKEDNKQDYIIGFNNNNDPHGSYWDVVKNINWRTDSIRGGQITILRFDSVNQIISGTFYFDCINKETGEVLKITDGRFDGYYTY